MRARPVRAVQAALQLASVGAMLLLAVHHTRLADATGWLALMVLVVGQVAAPRPCPKPSPPRPSRSPSARRRPWALCSPAA